MTSNASPPDLVVRAAERLQAPLADRHIAGGPSRAAEPPRGRDIVAKNSVTVSPTVLAANNIFLPSSRPDLSVTFEEYRVIRRHVLGNIGNYDRGHAGRKDVLGRTILVTSARPSDGKTFTSINLALSLAFSQERKVILMDGDARRRSLLAYMGISPGQGWLDYLERGDLALQDVILNTNIPNLWILPSGVHGDQSADLVAGRKMTALLEQLNNLVPGVVVIIDSLPCMVSDQPAILAEHVGQVLFVVAAIETGREEVQSSLRQLAGCDTVSLILNKGQPLMAEQFSKYGYYGYGEN